MMRENAKNNFDLFRLLAAFIVAVVHISYLTSFHIAPHFPEYLSADLAVKVFFVISGFLIFQSAARSRNIREYAQKRVRRIYPAYFTVIVLTPFLLSPFSEASISSYFSKDLAKYILGNLTFLNFLHPTLPGLFEGSAYGAVNGALWTLKVEVMFYIAVPIFFWLFRYMNRFAVLGIFYVLSVLWGEGFLALRDVTGEEFYVQIARQLPGQLSFFLAGGSMFLLHSWALKYKLVLFLGALPFLFIEVPFVYPAALGVCVCSAAFLFPHIPAAKFGDISYGLYIVHFPIIQTLWMVWDGSGYDGIFVAAVLSLSVGFSLLLWHLVEKRFLHRGNHYLAEEKDGQQTEVKAF